MTALVPAPYTTNIRLIRTGIVRNLQKTTYYLRIPKDPKRSDRLGRTIPIGSCQDVELDYRDWKLVESQLITSDFNNVLRIIRYPQEDCSGTGGGSSTLIVVNNWGQLPPSPPPDGTIVWVQYGGYQGIFYYDTVRNDWLSENLTTYTWSSSTTSTIKELALVSNADGTHRDNDVSIDKPMTVVGMSGSQVDPLIAGSQTSFRLDKTNMVTGVITENICSVTLSTVGERGVQNLSLNAKIDDKFMLGAVRISSGEKIVRPAATAWLRERLVP